jgi:hypothetical protein
MTAVLYGWQQNSPSNSTYYTERGVADEKARPALRVCINSQPPKSLKAENQGASHKQGPLLVWLPNNVLPSVLGIQRELSRHQLTAAPRERKLSGDRDVTDPASRSQ